eukprot:2520420-Rhodomonas_salina.1
MLRSRRSRNCSGAKMLASHTRRQDSASQTARACEDRTAHRIKHLRTAERAWIADGSSAHRRASAKFGFEGVGFRVVRARRTCGGLLPGICEVVLLRVQDPAARKRDPMSAPRFTNGSRRWNISAAHHGVEL